MTRPLKTLAESINDIDIEDLQYVEADLSFYQMVSLGFLLFGGDKTAREFVLQRIIILAQHPPSGTGVKQLDGKLETCGILTNYAKLNPRSWRQYIVEALAIIKAKRIIRKLGLMWQEIYQQYLPNIAELSVNIHPLIKALYKVCERLTPDQAARLISYVNMKNESCQELRFYEFSYLEVFLLNWLTKNIIVLGNENLKDCNVQILIEYFKFNDMDSYKDLLIETINQRLTLIEEPSKNDEAANLLKHTDHAVPTNIYDSSSKVTLTVSDDFDAAERYNIRRESAGYVVIINQNRFYEETDESLQHLLPDIQFKSTRNGTDIDRENLKELFSYFGYIPLVFNNLTHLEILHHIRETVKKSLLKDSIIICILTHGMEGAVYGCNSIPVAITEIREILTDDTLKGKPKIILLQACQRDDPKVDTTSSIFIQNFSADAYADILLAISAIRGTESLRDIANGSWFVESICKFIKKYGNRKHMLDILTAVTNDISKKKTDNNEFMLPETSTTLRKELYLPS